MKKYLEQLRSKSDAVKKQIALVSTIIIGGIIFLFWISTFSFQSNDSAMNIKAQDILGPLSSIKESAKDTYAQIKTNTQQTDNTALVSDPTLDFSSDVSVVEDNNDTQSSETAVQPTDTINY